MIKINSTAWVLFLTFMVSVSPLMGANRVTTWSAGQVLTASTLNSEFDNIYAGTVDRSGGRWGSLDDIPITFGTAAPDAQIEWDTTQTVDSLIVGLGSGLILNVMERADMSTNWGISSQTNPTLYVHSADATATTDFILLTHDQTNAVISAGSGVLNLQSDTLISGTTPLLTVGDAGAEDAQINFDGNATDFSWGLDDSADSLVWADETALGTDNLLALPVVGTGTSVQRAIFYGANTGTPADNDETYVSFHAEDDANNQVEIARISWRYLDVSAASDDSYITFDTFVGNSIIEVLSLGSSGASGTTGLGTFTADLLIAGTTPTITVGDAGAEDSSLVFDGNAQDFYVGLDDSADDLIVGLGSALGTTPAISIDENQVTTVHQDPIFAGTTPTVTIGDAGAEDSAVVFDGNAQDFYVGLDDSADDLVLGLGAALGTTIAIAIDADQVSTFYQDPVIEGTTPTITVGDAGAEDTSLVFDGNAQDYYVGLDDSADTMVLGVGAAVGTTPAITIASSQTLTLGVDLDVTEGGTGVGTFTDGGILLGSGTGDITVLGVAANGQIPIGDGTGDPQLATITGTSNQITVTNASASITLDFPDDLIINGTTPSITLGDAGTEDAQLDFDGNAVDFAMGLDDSADQLVIGLGTTLGTNPAITIDGDGTEDVTLAGDLTVSGVGPNSVGGAVLNYAALRTTGTFTSGGAGSHTAGLWVDGTIVGVSGDTTFNVGSYFSNSVNTVAASETITDVVQVLVNEPQVTKGSGSTITNATSLKVIAAPTEGTNNYALWVAAGATKLGGAVETGGDVTMKGTTPILTLGDGDAEDMGILWDGNAYDWYAQVDDSADDLIFGVGNTVATTPFLSVTNGPSVTITHENGGFVDIATSGSSGYLRMRGSTALESSASALTLNGGGLATLSLLSAVTANSTFTLTDGGTVTQATNHGTGVTLNTNSGQITLASVDLAAGAEATFTVTNSVVAATDVVIVNVSDDQDAGTLLVTVDDVGAGVFDIVLTNVHASAAAGNGGTVVNFVVIGGASS
ncbi:hypothetical protein [uncultured Mediterranean phage]|nr:hypothetical protein [uncultured Mediterranean phage]